MGYQETFYPESRFGGFTDVDGTVAFYTRVNSLIASSFTVVEFGCGRGAHHEDPVLVRRELRNLRGRVKRVIGLDVDEAARANPFVDECCLIRGERWPLESDSADLCICDNVLEHLEEPRRFFSESRRVLKAGGVLCVRTPNVWSYVGLVSRLIPHVYHATVLNRAQSQRHEEDVFPTLYRCNTIRRIRKMLEEHCFEQVVYGYEAEPSYLAFSRVAYWLGTLHQRFSPRFLRPAIFAFGRLRK